VKGPKGVYVQTADGPRDPDKGLFGNAVLAIPPQAQGTPDYFIPAAWKALNAEDLDLGSGSPLVFRFQGHDLVATSSKDAVVYLLDADSLGGADHATALYKSPRLGNDAGEYYAQGVWGSFSTYRTAKGVIYLYVPMWGPAAKGVSFPKANGEAPHGSIMAFGSPKRARIFRWCGMDFPRPNLPDVAVANGVCSRSRPASRQSSIPTIRTAMDAPLPDNMS
jgi:hypothetical protein